MNTFSPMDPAGSPVPISLEPEIRKAELYTEFTIGGRPYTVLAAGARSCQVDTFSFQGARTTVVFNLHCSLTYFQADHPDLGLVTIIDDPRRPILGQILLRRINVHTFDWPALSYFNQYLIFNVGQFFFYYPSPWQVESAISQWPPEQYQYHHLVEDTPLYDFNTREPNVARKGISTISILGSLTADEERAVRAAHERQVDVVKQQPGFQIAPEDFLSTPPTVT